MKRKSKNKKIATAPAAQPSPWLTTAQTADRISYSTHTLKNWRYEKKGPLYRRVGRFGKVRYHIRDVEKWERKNIKPVG